MTNYDKRKLREDASIYRTYIKMTANELWFWVTKYVTTQRRIHLWI